MRAVCSYGNGNLDSRDAWEGFALRNFLESPGWCFCHPFCIAHILNHNHSIIRVFLDLCIRDIVGIFVLFVAFCEIECSIRELDGLANVERLSAVHATELATFSVNEGLLSTARACDYVVAKLEKNVFPLLLEFP